MSLKRVVDTLMGFGLKQIDAQVYIFLAKKGPHAAMELSNALKLPKHRLYFCLNCLKRIRLVNASATRPALFSAVPFEEALNLLLKAKMEEAQRTQQDKDEALSDWRFIKQNTSRTR